MGLQLTGERTLPGLAEENYWFRRHEVAYETVLPWCRGATVLDAGCGEGYGAAQVATVARQVVGLDYDTAAAAHVRTEYRRVAAVRGNLVAMPLASGSVDVVLAMQVIEHLWDQPAFLRECARVLRPGGRLVVTTPNRLTFSPGRDTPLNPFHTRELTAAELADLLRAAGFEVGRMLGVHHGPALGRLDAAHGGSLVAAQLASAPEQWSAALRRDVVAVSTQDFDVRDTDIDASLDLFATATVTTATTTATTATATATAVAVAGHGG